MAKHTIADLALFRNRQNQIQEKITAYLGHLETLMHVVLSINFFELTQSMMHCYFLVVADLINDIIQLHQSTLIHSQEQ